MKTILNIRVDTSVELESVLANNENRVRIHSTPVILLVYTAIFIVIWVVVFIQLLSGGVVR